MVDTAIKAKTDIPLSHQRHYCVETSLEALQLGRDLTTKVLQKLTKLVNKLAASNGGQDKSVETAATSIKPDRQILADDFQLPIESADYMNER